MKKLVVALLVLVCLLIIMIGCLLALKLVPLYKEYKAPTFTTISEIKMSADAYVIEKPTINSPAVDSMDNDELKKLVDICVSGVTGNYIFKTWPQFKKEFFYEAGEYPELFFELSTKDAAVYELLEIEGSKEVLTRKMFYNGSTYAPEADYDFTFYGTYEDKTIWNPANNKESIFSELIDVVIKSENLGTFSCYVVIRNGFYVAAKINGREIVF